MKKKEQALILAANIFAGRDWHNLTLDERDLVDALEASGYIQKKERPNGFVGRSIKKASLVI